MMSNSHPDPAPDKSGHQVGIEISIVDVHQADPHRRAVMQRFALKAGAPDVYRRRCLLRESYCASGADARRFIAPP
jgi:hypothetical protein